MLKKMYNFHWVYLLLHMTVYLYIVLVYHSFTFDSSLVELIISFYVLYLFRDFQFGHMDGSEYINSLLME